MEMFSKIVGVAAGLVGIAGGIRSVTKAIRSVKDRRVFVSVVNHDVYKGGAMFCFRIENKTDAPVRINRVGFHRGDGLPGDLAVTDVDEVVDHGATFGVNAFTGAFKAEFGLLPSAIPFALVDGRDEVDGSVFDLHDVRTAAEDSLRPERRPEARFASFRFPDPPK